MTKGSNVTIQIGVYIGSDHSSGDLFISDEAKRNIQNSRDSLMKLVSSGANIYGVNTGFVSLLNVRIKPDKIEELQSTECQ